jgi:hypothetical protein
MNPKKTDTMNPALSNLPNITITQDQALAINLYNCQARALLLLLGTCLSNESVLSQWDPDPEEREGLIGLVMDASHSRPTDWARRALNLDFARP